MVRGEKQPIRCLEGENCQKPSDEPLGVCTEMDSLDACCPNAPYTIYDADAKTCKHADCKAASCPSQSPCPNGGYCSYGRFCVVGVNAEAGEIKLAQFKVCDNIPDTAEKAECEKCVQKDPSDPHLYTAIGCVPTSPKGLIESVLKLAMGLGGGIALLLMVYGAFIVAISAGDPKAADNGKQIFTSAIIGLLFIIFSVVILQIIGVQILQLPGF
jgi:hypothetical protein